MKNIWGNIFHIACFTIAYVGYANTSDVARIIGGIPVRTNTTYPYYISIQDDDVHICGGTIIDKNTVVTVAHCVVDKLIPSLSILAGTNLLESGLKYRVKDVIVSPTYHPYTSVFDEVFDIDDSRPADSLPETPVNVPDSLRPELHVPPHAGHLPGTHGRPVKKPKPGKQINRPQKPGKNNFFKQHRRRNPHKSEAKLSLEDLHEDDIALIKTEENFEYSESIRNANIVLQGELDEAKYNKRTAVIIGFGETDDNIIPKYLHQQEVNILTNEECEVDIGEGCHDNYDSDFQICMKPLISKSQFSGAGPRDDGGPVILNNKLAGIILHGKHEDEVQCHESSIALNINSYLDFILPIEHIKY